MEKNGILKRDGNTHQIEQIASHLSFGEAFSKVWDLRAKRDGNYYWIGSLPKKD